MSEKWQRYQRLLAGYIADLEGHDFEQYDVRVYTYPVTAEADPAEEEFFLEQPSLYPEDYAFYSLVRHVLMDRVGTGDPGVADFIFVPLNYPVYEGERIEIKGRINALPHIDSGTPHLFCAISDSYPRPHPRRANPYGITNDYFFGGGFWLDERFVVLTPESTIDLYPQDIGVMPLVGPNFDTPPGGERPWLFTFAGTLAYDIDGDHIRGRHNLQRWRALGAAFAKRAFVGTADEARAAGEENILARSVFALCPGGLGRWTFRPYEAARSGALPVFLNDFFVKPYGDRIDWDSFSLTLPEARLPEVGDVLTSLSDNKIAGMQQALARNRHHFFTLGAIDDLLSTLAARSRRLH